MEPVEGSGKGSGEGGDGDRRAAGALARQLELAQQITHVGSWQWDVATNAVTWSDELYRIYGLEPRAIEVTLERYLGMVHPDDRAHVEAAVQAALARGGRFAHREQIVRPDGSVRLLATLGEVLVDASGAATGLLGTCRDITEEVRRDEVHRLCSEVVDSMEIGISVWRIETPGSAAGIKLVSSNSANERLTGVSEERSRGLSLAACFPAAIPTPLPELMLGIDAEHPHRELAACQLARLPAAPTVVVKAFALPDRCVGLSLEDVTTRVRDQRMHFAERRALEMLAAGAEIEDILCVLVSVIEELAPDTLASVLILDPTGTRLIHAAAPSLPEAFNRAIDGEEIGPAAGSCGTAAYRRDAVFVSDIDTDPLWAAYRGVARAHGLRACWSTPILANDGRVLGTFAMYYRTPRSPTPAAIELLARAVHVTGIAIERRQLDQQLQALTERMEAIREDERTGIAREIHDELGQALTALKLDLAWVQRRRGDEVAVADKLREMLHATDDLISVVRRISSELRPGILDDLGLQAAIEWQSDEIERRTGIRCEVHSALGDLQLERDLATAIFRIFQEALTNVVRHANATHVETEVRLERGTLRLEISDNGVGVPELPARIGSLGLLGMRERARRFGGECVIQRREGGGTTVLLTMPLRFPSEQALERDGLRPRPTA